MKMPIVDEAAVEESPLLLPDWITNPFGQRATEDSEDNETKSSND